MNHMLEFWQGVLMTDLVFALVTIAFFALGICYLKACERLK